MAGTSINLAEEVTTCIEKAAAREKLTPDAMVLEAVEEHLRRKRQESLY